MRVLQLIDSLHPGGAERMAVTLANSLCETIELSALAVTRNEGLLKNNLKEGVSYIFLEKQTTLDLKALFKLRRFIKEQKINMVHAHTTSYFFASLLKLIYPSISVIWHEHQGNRVLTSKKQNRALVYCSRCFKKIITVNEELRQWCMENLKTKKVYYLSNFVDIQNFVGSIEDRQKTIVCLANLLQPKNHLNLLEAFNEVHQEFPDWNLELIGKDFQDVYSTKLKSYVAKNNLESHVSFLGSIGNAPNYLSRASIGVLSSDSEGLPMALLEYGASGLAVVSTKVGFCEEVISTFGMVVTPNDPKALSQALSNYTKDEDARSKDASNFKAHIEKNYSVAAVLPTLIALYKN